MSVRNYGNAGKRTRFYRSGNVTGIQRWRLRGHKWQPISYFYDGLRELMDAA